MKLHTVCKAIVVNSNGDILLLRRSATDERRPNEWDIPGGGLDGGEYPALAAARETREEAGIIVDPNELQLVYAMTEMVAADFSTTWLFHTVKTSQTDVKISTEHSAYQWLPLEKAVQTITYERQLRALQYVADNQLLES